jgi:hypothetical protein
MGWQTVQIQAAASFLRERIAAGDTSPRTKAIYEGLLDVLDPPRRATRVQRENSAAAKSAAAAAIKAERDRRIADRRHQVERRKVNLGSPTGVERRRGIDRRLMDNDRRNRS